MFPCKKIAQFFKTVDVIGFINVRVEVCDRLGIHVNRTPDVCVLRGDLEDARVSGSGAVVEVRICKGIYVHDYRH